jgi:hypothetical protein
MNSQELAQFREWFDRYVEDQLELRDEIRPELDQASADIDAGTYRVRQTPRE